MELFSQAAPITGLVMTKLDGTARGGILVALAAKFGLPVHFIGVGEGVEDLEPFAARDFARPSPAWNGTETMQIEAIPPRRHLPPLAKLGLEMGPLVLFFLANAFGERLGLDGDQVTYAAIALFVGATILSLGIHFALLRRVPIMPSSRGRWCWCSAASPWR